ncbi:MAG TPA: glycosyltransferase family 1 protein [Gemmatimonadaceae bacterium]|nr:glycosyltransferase family 1 protein [Gemmatimonadaceae bacterium]
MRPAGGRVSARGLRLALFTDTALPQLNGVSRTLARLVDEVRRRDGAVRVFTTADPAARDRDDAVRFASVPFWAYPQLRLAWPGAARSHRELRAWRPTLVHAATPFGVGIGGRRAAHAQGIPLVTSYHTSFTAYADFYHLHAVAGPGWRFLRWFHNGGRRTFCPTHAIADELAGRGFRGTAVWGRGVDAERFAPRWRSTELRRRLGAGDDDVLVAYVGRLAAEKGLDVLLDAVARVRSSPAGARVRFVFAGDGPYEAHSRRRAGDDAFVGRLEGRALSELYASADLFAFPSVTDTFGNVLLEAMASGLPVIAADVAASREVLGDGGAVLVPGGDGEALADAILRLAASAGERARRARQAHAEAGRRSWDAVFDALLAEYRSLAGLDANPDS